MAPEIPNHTVSRLRPLLGTLVAIEAETPRPSEASAAIEAAFGCIARVEALMRPATTGSDVHRIGLAAPGRRVRIDAWTYEVLRLSAEIGRASGGLFDPCRPLRSGRIGDIELAEDTSVVCRRRVALDLGGIAKGFAVDRAIEELRDHGCRSALVNAGGDLRVLGERARSLTVRTAHGAFPIELTSRALAVSGPRTADAPAEHCGHYRGTDRVRVAGRWVAVTARECAVADALCKCVMFAEGEELDALLATYRASAALPATAGRPRARAGAPAGSRDRLE